MNNEEKLSRWEDRRREYLSAAIALLVALASASLAFCSSLLTLDSVKLGGWRTYCFIAAVTSFVLALLAGLAVTFTRLHDARMTVKIVRAEGKSMADAYIEALRSGARQTGGLTWFLVYFQALAFFLGAVLLLISLYLIFHSKLFP